MRKQEINIYTFEELDEKTQKKVLDKLREWNTDCDWWHVIYDDAKNIDLDISSFDIDNRTIVGEFVTTADNTATKIISEHGSTSRTCELAQKMKASALNTMAFKTLLLRRYLEMLSNEYDYLTDDKTLLEQIKEGEYEYYEDGRQFMGA